MRKLVVVKAPQDMYKGISVPDFTEEPAAGAVTLSLYQAGDVDNINSCMDDTLGGLMLLELVKTLIRHLYHAQVGFHAGTVSICFTTGVGDTVENGCLANTGDPYYSAFQWHGPVLFWCLISGDFS